MKRLKFFTTLLLALFLLNACNSNSSKTTTDNKTSNPSSNTSVATGDEGSYSFAVAGKTVDEKGTLMEGYKADVTVNDGVEVLSFALINTNDVEGGISSFLFGIPNKTGSTTFTKENDKLNDATYGCTYTGASGHGGDTKIDPHVNNITINVEQLSDKRVSGTFSGTVIGEDGSSLLPVTDGKFNLPIYKNQ